MEKWRPGTEIILSSFDGWKSGVLPPMRRVIWRNVPSAGSRLALMERGKLKIVGVPIPNAWTYHGQNAVFNTMSYQNPELDKLVDAAPFTDDPQLYDQLMRQAIRVAMADVPRIPLWQPFLDVVTQANITGLDLILKTRGITHLVLTGITTDVCVHNAVYSRIAARGDDHVWISIIPKEAMARAARLSAKRAASEALPPLWGLPFGIKGNIDLAGVPTTAACPAYAYLPERSAMVVDRLIGAGAIPIGKTNLDQFATGLVGVRSPYGVPGNPFDPAYIPGGSSSGSAVAVATGLVSFALGTDTAGSARIPAAFCHVVGLKPTRGLIPTVGVVPACRSIACRSSP